MADRYVCAKCGSDRASKQRVGQRCSCGGTFVPKSYEGSLQQFETEPSVSEALLQKIGPDQDSVDGSDIESMDRLIEEDAPPGPGNPEHCPHCGEKGELIGFEMEGGNDWEHRVNGYECECGAEWEVQITGWDRPDGR